MLEQIRRQLVDSEVSGAVPMELIGKIREIISGKPGHSLKEAEIWLLCDEVDYYDNMVSTAINERKNRINKLIDRLGE